MRRLAWSVALVCVLALPSMGQSRRRGYTPAGGWHRRTAEPAPVAKKKKDKRPPQPPPPAPPTQ